MTQMDPKFVFRRLQSGTLLDLSEYLTYALLAKLGLPHSHQGNISSIIQTSPVTLDMLFRHLPLTSIDVHFKRLFGSGMICINAQLTCDKFGSQVRIQIVAEGMMIRKFLTSLLHGMDARIILRLSSLLIYIG